MSDAPVPRTKEDITSDQAEVPHVHGDGPSDRYDNYWEDRPSDQQRISGLKWPQASDRYTSNSEADNIPSRRGSRDDLRAVWRGGIDIDYYVKQDIHFRHRMYYKQELRARTSPKPLHPAQQHLVAPSGSLIPISWSSPEHLSANPDAWPEDVLHMADARLIRFVFDRERLLDEGERERRRSRRAARRENMEDDGTSTGEEQTENESQPLLRRTDRRGGYEYSNMEEDRCMADRQITYACVMLERARDRADQPEQPRTERVARWKDG